MRAEWLLRTALLLGLALALWRSLQAPPARTVTRRTDARTLFATLDDATRSSRVLGVDVTLDSMPDRAARAWLAALRHAGVNVRWSGAVPALALQVERSREPSARVRIATVADSGAALALTDSAGALDTLHASARGASVEAAAVVGRVRAAQGRFSASATVPAPIAPRAVLVLGRAAWETRFVAAALEEAGWTVRTRQAVAPAVVVADAGVLPIDTARYAVVVALDSTARDLAPTLARFVAQGGGLVLAGETPMLPALAPLSPARTTARQPGRILLDADSVTRPDLPLRPLAGLRGDAVRLEGSASAPRVAVRRAGLGRVLVMGYDDTWRWRMLGGASGPAAHREWWSRTVALVAPASPVSHDVGGDAAPLAALIEVLGPPTPASAAMASPAPREPLPLALLALIVALLLAETASRRFRGER